MHAHLDVIPNGRPALKVDLYGGGAIPIDQNCSEVLARMQYTA